MEIKVKLPVVIHKDPESDYGVTVPDLPGCFSAGSNVEEALTMAKEAIECHLEGMLLDGEAIPAVQAIEQHQQNPDYRDGFWAFVDVDISKLAVKSRRVNITIPEKLLNKVDMYARNHGESRSGLLAQAVTEYMSSHR
jgi:predicted RNase H-like HicB family nuclease